MNGNKTVREIWNVTHQSSTYLQQGNKKESERTFNETDSPIKNDVTKEIVNDPKNSDSYYTYFGNQYPKNFLNSGRSGDSINFKEEKNTSDQSIWTPTVNDNFKKSLNQQFYPHKEIKNPPPSQYLCEPEKSDEDDFKDCYETEYSECNDEINEQTFEENADSSSQSELTLKDISKATEASHKYLQNTSTPEKAANRTRYKTVYSQKCYQTFNNDLENDKYLRTESEILSEKFNERSSVENETSVKIQQRENNFEINGQNGEQKNRNSRSRLCANFSSNSPTMGHENPAANYSPKYPKENSPRFSRMTTVKTKEVFGEGGSICHRTVEKTVYIQGKKIDKVKETLNNYQDRKIIWNSNICLFDTRNEHFNRSSNDTHVSNMSRNFSHNRRNYFKERSGPKFRNNYQRKIMKDNYFDANKNGNMDDKLSKQSDSEINNARHSNEHNKSACDNSKKQIPTAEIINFDEQEENNTVAHQTSKNEISSLTYFNESEYCCSPAEKNRVMKPFKGTTQNKLYYDAVEDKNKKKNSPLTIKSSKFIITTDINPKSGKLVGENTHLEKNNDLQRKVPLLDNPDSETNSMKNERKKVIDGLQHAKKDVDQKIASDKTKLRSILINNGQQLANFIIESQRGYESFKSFYDEWIDVRNQSIVLLEQIVAIIDNSKKSMTIRNVIQAVNIAANLAANAPHPGVAAGAGIVAGVTGVLGKLFQSNNSSKDEINSKEFQIRRIFQRDMDTSSSVYIKGVMCGTQFEETCKFMKTFNEKLVLENYWYCFDDTDVLEFFDEISVYNSSNPFAFYKRLKCLYERLIQNSTTDESKYFIRVFEDVPEAIGVVNLLPWRFDSDGFDNSVVQNAWDELFEDFDHSETANINAFSRKIKNCLYFLKKEQDLLIRSCRELFK